ncbi:MAG: long-chain fatty acid--CoA ligase [Paludibacteraceae bacterium]|nr:long-chain fatty acid--CoA ligase [Paludibacteraceae bacterium]
MTCDHLGKIAFQKAKEFADRPVLKYKDETDAKWKDISWGELAQQIKVIAHSLIEMGVKEEDRIAIFSQNMVEIIAVDLACQAIRATTVPLYATSSSSQVEYIVNDAQISLIFAGEQYQYDRSIEVLQNSQYLKKVIAIDPSIQLGGNDAAISFEDFKKHGEESKTADAELAERQNRLSLNDLTTLIYTSGTTGEPKGVILRQSNYQQAFRIHDIRLTNVNDKDLSLSFLPLSHIFERAWTYFCMYKNVVVAVNKNPKMIQQVLKEVRPTMMCAVPRFWEKIYMGVNDKIDSFSPLMKKLMKHAVKIGEKRNLEYKRYGKQAPLGLNLQYLFYKKTLFKLLKKVIGLDRGLFFPTAGAALSDDVNVFLHSVGFNICVGYGLTESTATVSCYNPYNEKYEIHSAGDIMPEVEVKIGENDEILLRGKTITEGYYNKPEANETGFIDGWFRTGDAGYLTKEGRLVIRERIKELFKTSNGKYVAPQQVESKLIVDKYIEQAAIIADQRKYVSALIVPAYATLEAYAETAKIKYETMEDLLKNEKIISFYEGRIQQLQGDLAAYEQVKRFTLLARPFTPENDELTLTLKLKRKVISHHYEKEIEEMYL